MKNEVDLLATDKIDLLAEILTVASAMSLVGELTPLVAKFANSLLARQELPQVIIPVRCNGRNIVATVEQLPMEALQWIE